MKKIILSLIVFLLLIGIAFSQPLPYVVGGHIYKNGESQVGVSVHIQDVDNARSVDITTDDTGYFAYVPPEWYAARTSGTRYYSGSLYKISVCDVSLNSACEKDVEIGKECPTMGGCDTSFDVAKSSLSITYICSDGSSVSDSSLCPKVISPTPTTIYKCKDGTEVDDSSKCLETKAEVQSYIQKNGLAIGSVSTAFVGLVIYYILRGKRIRAKKMLDTRIKKLLKK